MTTERAKRWGFILIFAGFAIGIPGILLLVAPPHYEATAQISLTRSEPDASSSSNSTYDPYFIQTEYEVIKSQAVLGNVVTNLHLDKEWGKRYANGQSLTEREAIELLRQCLRLRPVRNTTLINIGVISEDPIEAAKIANAIARTHLDERWKQEEIRLRRDPRYRGMIIDRPTTFVNPAQPSTSPSGPNRTLGKILLGGGVLLILAGVRLLWRNYFAAPTEA